MAYAESLPTLRQVVREQRLDDPIFEKVPRADVRFIGLR
jgi:hypothetical protein